MIRFKNTTKVFPNGNIGLKNISLEIRQGEFVFLTGNSGAGKTTLLRLTALLDRATQGSITVFGHSLASIEEREIPYYRRNLGLVFQDTELLLEKDVFDNVAMPLWISGVPQRDVKRRVRAALDKVGLLSKGSLAVGSLSAGEQQRVGIARAVVNRPKVLLADEPTANLDSETSAEILNLFDAFNAVGVTVFIATHDRELLTQKARRIIRLENGALLSSHGT